MGKDSQNSISDINFIKNIKKSFTGGSYNEPVIDCHVDKEEIFVAFDLYRDLFKL